MTSILQRGKDERIVADNLRVYFDNMKRQIIAGPGHHTVVALNIGNTDAHELAKTKAALKLIREGRIIITEGILKNGNRPDITVLDLPDPIVYEIIESETKEHAEGKDYMGMRKVVIKAGEMDGTKEKLQPVSHAGLRQEA